MSMAVAEEQIFIEVADTKAEGGEDREEESQKMAGLSRKEKRKTLKKMKRKQIRKELAEKEKEEEDAKLNDPEEQARLKAAEEEEARRRERELKEFEERERAWMEEIELKKKQEEEREEEEKQRRGLEESAEKQQVDEENKCNEDDEWEYVEEGPPEVIFQGNEIILRKKKVRVRKKQVGELGVQDDANRLTSNPLPPESKSFADYETPASASQVLESVAQQVPNFGTERDKAHCPFHLKTGACRFGQRCSRVHFYPDKSCTLLMKNMYTGPGLAWEQDEGLENLMDSLEWVAHDYDHDLVGADSFVLPHTDEEVKHCYEEFYDDVHTEFMKFGEIINFKVCKNGSFHLRGNVYVHFKSLESAVLAYQSINGRYFGGKQVNCEFVNVTKWKVAICGEFMKSRLKACSRGTACNFIHCFRNPGGDYEWADWDKPPPRYWVKKMVSLFGYSDEHEKQIELNDSASVVSRDSHREPFRRSSRSRDPYRSDDRSAQSYINHRNHIDNRERISERREGRYRDYGSYRSRSRTGYSGDYCSDGDMEEDGESIHESSYYADKTTERKSKWETSSPDRGAVRKRICLDYYDDDKMRSTDDGRKGSEDPPRRSSRNHARERSMVDDVGREKCGEDVLTQEMSNRDRDKHKRRRTQITESAGKHKKESQNAGSITDWSTGNMDDNDADIDGDKSRLHHHKSSGCSDRVNDDTDRVNKVNDYETSSRAERFDGDEEGGRHSSHKRKEDNGLYLAKKRYDTDSSEDKSERKRRRNGHHSHKRRHSRNHHKVSESPENRTVHGSDCREYSLVRWSPNEEYAAWEEHQRTDHEDDELQKSDGVIDGLDRWKP